MATVMVTGVGAIIGYGALRSLKASHPSIQLVGADIFQDAVGQAWCDRFVQAPLTSDPNFPSWLERVVKQYEVDLIIPAIEQDVLYFSDNRSQIERLRCSVVLNTKSLIDLSSDKWAMDRDLQSINEPSRIPSVDNGSFTEVVEQVGLPFLLKPKRGYASKGIILVEDEATFNQNRSEFGSVLIAQQLVGSDDREFTVSIFGDAEGGVLAMSCLRRRLAADGSTVKAISEHHDGLVEVVKRLAQHFRPEGPTNFQFREVGHEWKLLEINPRISSSTSIRTAFGYNESAMCVDYYLNGIRPSQPVILRGHAERYIEEVVVLDRDHF